MALLNARSYCSIVLSLFVTTIIVQSHSKNDDTFTIKTSDLLGKNGNVMSSPVLFEKLFQFKRSEQKSALKQIVDMESYEKQYKLVKLVVTKIMEVLSKSRVKLESSGYLPGSDLPQDDALRDALSSMIENAAFMGDLVLYLPDFTKELLKNNEWSTVFKWSLSLCQETKFLDKNTKKMFHLVTQELNLIEREPNYYNPYAKANQSRRQNSMPVENSEKKARKKISRGPSLSGARPKNEL